MYMPSSLSEKQLIFVKEYLVDLNGTQAAIRAGYSKKTATEQSSRLLTNVKVQQEVQKLMDERSKRTEITADYVLKGIVEIIERCKQAEPVTDRDGNPIGEYAFQSSSALKGYELLGKHLKLFTDKTEHSGDKDKPIAFTVTWDK